MATMTAVHTLTADDYERVVNLADRLLAGLDGERTLHVQSACLYAYGLACEGLRRSARRDRFWRVLYVMMHGSHALCRLVEEAASLDADAIQERMLASASTPTEWRH